MCFILRKITRFTREKYETLKERYVLELIYLNNDSVVNLTQDLRAG